MKLYIKKFSETLVAKMLFSVRFFVVVLIIIANVFSAQTLHATAGIPKLINFQGRLMDNTGALLGTSGGTDYCFKFSIYDATTAGTKIWPTAAPTPDTLVVRTGVFDATIGVADTLDLAFTDDQAFVNVAVSAKSGTCDVGETGESYETLTPRPQIVSSAFAINSGTVGGFTPAQSATNNQIPVLTSGAIVLGHATTAGLASTGSNALTIDAGTSGILNLNNTSTGNILLGGGSLSTGCTLTNTTGAFACTAGLSGVGVNAGAGLLEGQLGLTITGAAVSLNASSNFDVNIATGTSTGDITLGGGTAGQLISINSDDWDISTAGAMTGISGIANNGAYTQSGSSANAFTGDSTFSGFLRATGAIAESAQSIDRIDIGVNSGTPRMVFEDSGSTIWQVDNFAGTFRWFTPGQERFTLDSSGNVDIKTGGLRFAATEVITSGRAAQNLTGVSSSGTIAFSGLSAN